MTYHHNPFSEFDILISAMRDNFLIETTQLILEAQAPNTTADSEWYIKWKADSVMTLKNAFAKFKEYAYRQINKYGEWLRDNQKYFDTQTYPPPSGSTVPNAPDYKAAINRIKQPFSNMISDSQLNQIQIGNTEDSGSMDNRWFMKILIKDYNGTGDDFSKYCVGYYNGEDKRKTLTPELMVTYIPFMYKYCSNYAQMVTTLENQMNGLILYINQDPVSGQQAPSDTAQKDLNTLNNDKLITGKASTNPGNNVVNASAHDMFIGMVLHEVDTIQNAPQSNTGKPVTNTAQVKTSNMMVQSQQQRPNQQQQQKQPQNRPIDQKQALMKKKKMACTLVRECFNAKVNATGNIYRDFIVTLQTVYHLVKEKESKKKKR